MKSYVDFDVCDPWKSSIIEYDDNCISQEDKKLIETVVTKLSKFSATDLVNITHNQAPWKDVYRRYQNNEITIESMRKYFRERE